MINVIRIKPSAPLTSLLSHNYVSFLQPRQFSTAPCNDYDEESDKEPKGDLFNASVGEDILGKYASIKRVFGPRSNSQAMLTHGGPVLARHSSFDPAYSRAKLWIRHHPVGPALISPVLVNGIIGALVEASLPHSVPISTHMKQLRPLIVGVSYAEMIYGFYISHLLKMFQRRFAFFEG